ncbi:sigma-54-dependent Fis family transcriptional regulator [Dactylosporangium sp. NPDC048998]|uniref:sigma-54-dependent Fis family transcriptional regulator n=1 Tax=Dactylosporangium sp. NPDC048998 TaxID=3363976 RepID=UPI00371F06C4
MPDTDNRLLRVAAARADFLESGRAGATGVPDVLAASWERSQAAGVDSGRPHSDYTSDIDLGSRLVRCARPVLTQLGNDTADLPLVIALTDHKARLVQRIDLSSAVGRLLDRVEFAPGFNYSESTMGTNGVGTVLEAGQPISIVGPEHFTEHLQSFACTGAPVIDPLTGRVEGVLDISTLTQTWSPLMHTLAKSAAKDISRNLLLDRSQSQHAVFETYLRVEARASRQAVFAFGDSVFIANAAAQGLFNAGEQLTLREHATFLMSRRDRVSDTLVLPGGRMVHIRGTRILAGAEVAGMVVIADLVTKERAGSLGDFTEQALPQVAVASPQTSRIAGDLYRPHEAITGGRSPAWVRACDELREALAAQVPAIVLGETGSGKFTLVAEIFHASHPVGRSVSMDAAQLTIGSAQTDINSLLAGKREPTLYIVRNVDQATTDGVEQLDAFFTAIGRLGGPTSFVATLSDSSLDSDLPFHALLGHFEVAINVPPLRCRTDDLAAITSSVLREIAPNRKVRLSPDAERVIARYSWPRNVSQLREALEHALRRRPVGEIQAQDLPAYCQTTSRHVLTPLETAERDAIVAALQETDGNRVLAAARLGMSRSSLYRKLKVYGITA